MCKKYLITLIKRKFNISLRIMAYAMLRGTLLGEYGRKWNMGS